MKNTFDKVPEDLKSYSQWVVWKLRNSPNNPHKKKKVPYNPSTGRPASTNDPTTWTTFQEAVKGALNGQYDGIGFVFSRSDPFVGIDLDKCRDKKSGEIGASARKIIDSLGTYTEVSPSGTGIHIIAKGRLPGKGINSEEVEMYDRGRFFTITGQRLMGTVITITARKETVRKLYEGLAKPVKLESARPVKPLKLGTAKLVKPVKVKATSRDKEAAENVCEMIGKVAQGGNSQEFQKLLNGDTSSYASQSEADLAFCSYLSRVCTSPRTIDKIFRSSKLYRAKWDELRGDKTYGEKTISKVLRNPNMYSETVTKETSQYNIAQEVIKCIGKENIFSIGKQFVKWNEKKGVWEEVQEEEIKKLIHKTAYKDNITQFQVNSILGLIRTEVHARNNRFKKVRRRIINCKNGELHYEAGRWHLRGFSRSNYFIHQIPVAYDEHATSKRYKRFLNQVFAQDSDKKEKIMLLQEFLGYALTASCEFERFLMLVGSGANGKSVILSVITALLGQDNVAGIQPSLFEDRFTLAHLQGKLANIITEIPHGAVVADAKLKSLVSGERMTVQRKFGQPFDIEPYATLIFATNHLPHTKDFSPAFFRRAEILTFNREFKGEDCDTTLKERLSSRKELPGILNFALEGLKRLYDNGDFTKVHCSTETKKEWERAADQVKAFVDDECTLEPGSRASVATLYDRYTNWAQECGLKSNVNKHNFSSRLVRLGCEHGRGSKGVRMMVGIRLKRP